MIFSLYYFLSVMVFWGIPLALGAAFWQVSVAWIVIMAVGWVADAL